MTTTDASTPTASATDTSNFSEKLFTKMGRFGTAILTATIEAGADAAIDVVFKAFGPEKLNLLIDNNWNILDSIYYNLRGFDPDWGKINLTQQEKVKVERMRRSDFLKRMVLPGLERAKWLASKFGTSAIEEKVTAEWLIGKGEETRPVIIEILNARGEAGRRWLEKQAEQFREFFCGRLVWSDALKRMVSVEELKTIMEKMGYESNPTTR